MNDELGKKAWRSLLVEHNKEIGLTMTIPDPYYCQYGTRPRCRQSIPSVDLFNLLEPLAKQFGFFEEDLEIFHNEVDPHLGYTSYDLSFVLGQGQCVPTWLKNIGDNNLYEWYGVPAVDCSNIFYALYYNPVEVFSAMKHSIQPPGHFRSPEQLFEDFPTRKVVRALENSAKSDLVGAIGEHLGPRVIHCADSMENSICESVQRVLSSEGSSIGFNAINQSGVMLESPENKAFFEHFLRPPIIL